MHHRRRQAFRLVVGSLVFASLLLGAPAHGHAAGGLKVVQVLPRGQVQRLDQIVVRFDRPMAPLGAGEVAPDQAPLVINPRPRGSFRWLDPNTLAFILARPLSGASRFAITVPAGAKALDGAALAKPVRVRIDTLPIAVLDWSPAPGKALGPKPSLSITVNQPLVLESTAGRIWFVTGGRRLPAKIAPRPLPRWHRSQPRLSRDYQLSLDRKLSPGAQVDLVMEPGIMPAQGDLALERPIIRGFTSYAPLRLERWIMDKALGGGYDPASALVLRFNNPVDPAQALKYVTCRPRPEITKGQAPARPSRWLSLPFKFKPSTRYRISVKQALQDQYGTTQPLGATWAFNTGNLSPVFNLPPGNGVLESTQDPTLPLKLRNLPWVRAGLRWLAPSEAVPALVAEDDRPWNQAAKPLDKTAPNTRLSKLALRARPNQTVIQALDLEKLLGRGPGGGLVLLDLRSTWPDRKGKPRTRIRRSLVQVTGLGLSLKLGVTSGAAWVTRLKDGRPLPGVSLELRDRENRVLWQGISGPDGLALLPSLKKLSPALNRKRPWENPQVYLLARHQADFAILPGAWGDKLRYSIPPGISYTGPGHSPALAAQALFQLPLYQPGQTVRYVLFLRSLGAQGATLPAGQKIKLRIEDPQGRAIHRAMGQASRFGTKSGEFQLTPKARLGSYSMAVQAQGKTIWAGSFRVASFRPPDFKVSLSLPRSLLDGAAPPTGQLDARYLFGAPVAAGKASLRFSQQRRGYVPPLLQGFAVGDIPLPGEPPRLSKDLGQRELKLGAKGRGSFALPVAKPAPGLPVALRVEARVSDAAGLAVNRSRSLLVHPADLYLGIKTPVVARAGHPAGLQLKAASAANAPLPGVKVTLKAYKQYWETVRERAPGGYFRHLGVARRKLVWQGGLELGPKGAKQSFTPPKPGTYVIVAEAQDAKGRLTRSAAYLWASGGGAAGWQRFDDHRLELVAGQSELSPGQSLELMLKNPFATATALISVERMGVLRTMVRRVSGPAPVIRLPIEDGDAPGVYVGVLLVRGRVSSPRKNGPDLGRPQVRVGYVKLKMRGPGDGLTVALSPQTALLRPGEKAAVELKVSQGGQPVQGEVTLLAVDERILSAAGGGNYYDPRRGLNRMPSLAVASADLRTRVLGRFMELQKDAQGGPGGGGGSGPAMRRRFHPAVFWLAQAMTDAKGRLRAEFTLPGSLTSYRVVAVATGPKGAMGLGKAAITARLPMQMLPALPRFAVKGDSFTARVLVQNLSDQPGEAHLSAKAGGLTLTGPAQARVKLAPGQSRAVGFAVSADKTGNAFLEVTARMGAHQDAARFSLPVVPATQLVTSAAAGMLGPKDTAPALIPVGLPQGAATGRGGLKLSLAPSLAPALARPTEMLARYPWDCLEQRLSRGAALAMRLSEGVSLGLPAQPGDQKRVSALGSQVMDFQGSDGGFAFWPGLNRSDMLLTAYLLIAQPRLAGAGFQLPGEVKKRALSYLERRLKRRKAPRASDDYARTAEAMAIYALAAQGRKPVHALNAVMSRSRGLAPFSLACLMRAAGIMKRPAQFDALAARLEASAVVSAAGLHFAAVSQDRLKLVLGSRLRGNALALEALAMHRPGYPRLDALARWVAAGLGGKSQISTQDAAFGLWGLAAYLKATKAGAKVRAVVSLAGRKLAGRGFAGALAPPLTVMVERSFLRAGERQELSIAKRGAGSLFWSARLSHAPGQPAMKPVNAGLGVSRYLLGKTRTGPALGDELEYVITIIAPQTRRQVLVQAPFPAGLEPLGAAQNQAGQAQGSSPWLWHELRRSALILYAPSLRPGVYTYRVKLRAMAPGRFVFKPVRAEEMYAPEVFGASRGGVVVVR